MCNMQAMSPLCLLHLRRASCILFQREGTRGHVCYRRRRYVPVASSVNAIVCLPLPGLPQAVWRCSAGSFFGEGRRCCGGGSACCSPDTTGPRRRIACGPSEVCGQRRWWGDGSVRGILPPPVKGPLFVCWASMDAGFLLNELRLQTSGCEITSTEYKVLSRKTAEKDQNSLWLQISSWACPVMKHIG